MAFIGLKIPMIASAKLAAIKVQGNPEDPFCMHVTMIHLGNHISLDQIYKATTAAMVVTRRWRPFSATTRFVTSFDKKPDDGIPVIAKIDSQPLHDLKRSIERVFTHCGIEYSKKFPDFKPHITLSYSQEESPDIRIMPISWQVDGVTLWGGDKDRERLSIDLPFLAQQNQLIDS